MRRTQNRETAAFAREAKPDRVDKLTDIAFEIDAKQEVLLALYKWNPCV